MIVFNVFPGTKSPNHLFTTFSGNSVGFIILITDNIFSKPHDVFLEPEHSQGGWLELSQIKKSYYFLFIIECVIWKGAKLSLNDCELFPSGDFYHALLCMK